MYGLDRFHQAPIDVETAASGKRCAIKGQERNQSRHFIRHFETLERHKLIRKVLEWRCDMRTRVNGLDEMMGYPAIFFG